MKIIIVGAGIAGLAAGYYLSGKGHQVEIYESSNRPGGRAITLKRKNSIDKCDVGSQYFHSNYRRTLKLIKNCNLNKNLEKVSGYTRYIEESGSFDLNHRYPWINSIGFKGNIKLGYFLFKQLSQYQIDPYTISLDHPSDYNSIYDITNNPDVIKYIVRPLTLAGGLSLPNLDELSHLHLIRLIKIVIASDYLCLTSGNESLHNALANQLVIHYEKPVESVVQENKKIIGIKLKDCDQIEKADHIIIATPAPCAAKLLPGEWQKEINFLNDILTPSFPLVNMFLDRPLNKNIWSYILPEKNAVMLCTDAAQKNPNAVPSGKSILQAWPCYPRSQDLIKRSDEEISSICIDELAQYFPQLPNWIEYTEITRHKYAVPQFNIGHNHNASLFIQDIKRRGGISFCGDYFSGGYMESAVWSAEMISNDIR